MEREVAVLTLPFGVSLVPGSYRLTEWRLGFGRPGEIGVRTATVSAESTIGERLLPTTVTELKPPTIAAAFVAVLEVVGIVMVVDLEL